MWVFFQYMLRNLAVKSLSHRPLTRAIRVVGVLASKTILKIYYRSSSKYLVIENIARDIAGSLGLIVELGAKNLSNSFILLEIGKKI